MRDPFPEVEAVQNPERIVLRREPIIALAVEVEVAAKQEEKAIEEIDPVLEVVIDPVLEVVTDLVLEVVVLQLLENITEGGQEHDHLRGNQAIVKGTVEFVYFIFSINYFFFQL